MRPRWSGVILPLILASLRRRAFDVQRLQQEIRESFDEALRAYLQWGRRRWTLQIENELRSIVILASPHGPSPSSLKDVIVRPPPDSRRAQLEQRQVH